MHVPPIHTSLRLKQGATIGSWVVEEPLGAGGMGAVYRCRSTLSSRVEAAVKVFRPDGDNEKQRKRFVREVETLSALQHPAIVRMLGGGEQDGLLWFAMDAVEGRTLKSRLKDGPLSVPEAIEVFGALADGLAHCHAQGITHRDIKPENIMLRPSGAPVLIDFGIAKQADRSALTDMGSIPGTVPYIDPVLLRDGKAEPAQMDIYALGLVLYEALSGNAAFEPNPELVGNQQIAAILAAKIRADPFDPGEGFPTPLRELVQAATTVDPADRPASFEDFAKALGASRTTGRVWPRAVAGFVVAALLAIGLFTVLGVLVLGLLYAFT